MPPSECVAGTQRAAFLKILFVSDAWRPQINGVVRTLEATVKELERLGHETRVVGPDESRWLTFALPIYPEIKLEFLARTAAGAADGRIPAGLLAHCDRGPVGFRRPQDLSAA